MVSLETYVAPHCTHIADDFVESLVSDGLLPVDVAFRSQWLPYEMMGSDGKRHYQPSVLEQDILAATGRTARTEFYNQYLSADAPVPSCVTVQNSYNLRKLIASSEDDWHMYADYRTIVVNSDSPHPFTVAKRSWHTLILTALRHSASSLDWVDTYDFEAVYKRNNTGHYLRNNIGATVIRDEVLLEIAAEAAGTGRLALDSLTVGGKMFSALELLLADNHPNKYAETYATWLEQSYDAIAKKISSLTAVETLKYFKNRGGQYATLTDFQLDILKRKYHEEDDDETYNLILRTERAET